MILNDIENIYIGNTPIEKIIINSQQVWINSSNNNQPIEEEYFGTDSNEISD